MKWNIAYTIYEGIALLVILICLGAIVFVSPTTYQKQFEDLQINLNGGLKASKANAMKALDLLKKDVKKNGNPREGLERITRAQLLKRKTDSLTRFLEIQKVNISSGEQSMVEVARKTEETLDTFYQWIVREFMDLDLYKFDKLTEGNAKKVLYHKDWFFKEKDFAHTHFAHTTVAAANALLTQKQLKVKRYESEVLKKLGAGDLTSNFGHNYWFGLRVVPALHQVQVGDEYTAFVTLNANASRAKPRFWLGNTQLAVKDGKAEVVLRTKKTGKQYWKAKIAYLISHRRDTVITHWVPFWVLPKDDSIKEQKK